MQETVAEKKTIKDVLRAMIWNSGGVGFYLACKWSLTILVVRLSTGYDDAGYLALAVSITNLFFFFAAYGTRSYQVSDEKGEHTTNTYITARLFTVITAQLFCVVFCLAYYGFDKRSAVIIFFMFMMSGEAFSDVLHGVAQRNWRMDIVGKSFFLRGIILISTFVSVYIFSDLTLAILCSSLLTLLMIYIYDIRKVNAIEPFQLKSTKSEIISLLKKCFPLMIVTLLIGMFVSSARITLEINFGVTNLGVFSSATVPAAILFSVASFVFVPCINILSKSYDDSDYKRFIKQFLSICSIIIALVSLAILVSELIGGFLLSILFGEEIIPYAYLLTEALIASGLCALLWFMIITLTVIRKLIMILISCLSGLLCCVLSASWLMNLYGMSGANYMQIVGFGIALAILLVYFSIYMLRLRKS